MKYLSKLTTIAFVAANLLSLNTAVAKTLTLQNCQQLQASNAVLLVHASWCPHCRDYLPTYNAVSNLPEMKKYKFYVKRDDSGAAVCGTSIRTVPVTFKNNMRNSMAGELTQNGLVGFVRS